MSAEGPDAVPWPWSLVGSGGDNSYASRDRGLLMTSSRSTYDGGHFSYRHLSTTFLIWQVPLAPRSRGEARSCCRNSTPKLARSVRSGCGEL